MAAVPDREDGELFERIFEQPKISDLLELDSDTFEKFIGYMFTAAGYAVKIVAKQHYPAGPGVDINLCSVGSDKPIFRVEVKRYGVGNPVQFKEIKEFFGALGLGQGKLPGYFITTSDFTEPAKAAAQEYNGKVRLINGHQLIRYITYLRGSRIHDSQGLRHTALPTPPDWLWNENGPYQSYHCAPTRTLVMAVANHKGGVAKTTTALNVGAALAQQGHDVLLIDLDGQANLSSVLPLPDPSPKPPKNAPIPLRTRFVSEWFSGQVSALRDIVQPTRFPHLWIAPATRELHRMDRGGTAEPGYELSFSRAVHDLSLIGPSPSASPTFRYIILDTPPAQSMYSRLALAASHVVLLPINVEVFAGFGIGGITETAVTMRALVGGDVRIVGAVRTRYKPTATVKKEEPALRQALEQRGIRLFETVIPIDDKIEQAHIIMLNGGIKGLFGFPTSVAAEAYKKLVVELLQEV